MTTPENNKPSNLSTHHSRIQQTLEPFQAALRTLNLAHCILVLRPKCGRYWDSVGPVHTLYVPASFLSPGRNSVILLELDAPPPGGGTPFVEFVGDADVDPPSN